LREPEESDAEALHAYYARNAERFAPWEPPRPHDVEAHRAWVVAARRSRRGGKPAVFLAFDRASGALVAVVDLHGFSDEDAGAMISYTVDGDYEGRGFASEAVAAVMRYAAEDLGLRTITAYYEPANVRSERLLQRAGFTVVASTALVPGFEKLMRAQVVAVRKL
jgi:ribosomal-protein-alanine N-acetyltransferase